MKITFVLILSLIALPNNIKSACNEGTLQCNSSDESVICDFMDSYTLNTTSKQCDKNVVEGCIFPSYSVATNPCTVCEPGKVLDSASTKCVDVATDQIVENCMMYQRDDSSCFQCNPNYFLGGGACTEIGDAPVSNCGVQSSATVCQTCKLGYYLDANNACILITKVDNCQKHTNRQCDSCESNYSLNRGYNNPVDLTNDLSDIIASFAQEWSYVVNSTPVCQKNTIKNCSVHSSFDTCTACSPSYFLKTNPSICERFPEAKLSNCVKYSNKTTCTECKFKFFVNSSSTCEAVTEISDCTKYMNNSDTCIKCGANQYYNQSTSLCTTRTKDPGQCTTKSDVLDGCLTCDTGYSPTEDSSACFADIDHCTDHNYAADDSVTGGHTCTTCAESYYPNANSCSSFSIGNCASPTPNTNTCGTCNSNHVRNAAGTLCTPKSIDNCVTFTASTTVAACGTCESLYYPNNSGADCANIDSHANCLSSEGLLNSCTECKKEYKLEISSGSLKSCANARTELNFDTHCIGNKSDADDTKCSKCDTDYIRVDGLAEYATAQMLTELNCNVIKTTDVSKCSQCIDDYELNSNGECISTGVLAANKKCVMKIVDNTSVLSEPTDCAKCDPTKPLYLLNGTCTANTKFSSVLDCQLWTEGVDSHCKDCNSGFNLVNDELISCSLDVHETGFFPTSIDNCVLYNQEKKCVTCEQDYELNADQDDCASISGNHKLLQTFDANLNPQHSLKASTEVSGCSRYSQYSEDTILCTQCETDTVPIVGYIDSKNIRSVPTGSSLSPFKTIHEGLFDGGVVGWNPILECIPKANVTSTSGASVVGNPEECAIGVKLTDGYVCLRCKGDKIGTIHKVMRDFNADTDENNEYYYGVFECDTATGMTQTEKGVGYNILKTATTSILWNNHVSHTGCSELNETLIWYAKLTGRILEPISASTDTGQTAKQGYCVKTSVLPIAAADTTNCQIYAFTTSLNDNDFDPTITSGKISQVLACIACEAGFKADGDGAITACVQIPTGCSGGNWLNGCETPANPWILDISDKEVKYDEVHTSPILNCLAFDTNFGGCSICKLGFTPSINGFSCEEITTSNTLCQSGELGMGRTALRSRSTETKTVFLKGLYLRLSDSSYSNYSTDTNYFCNSCDSSRTLYKNTGETSGMKCAKLPANFNKTLPSDCLVAEQTGTDAVGCVQCANNFILNTFSKKCVAQSDFENCKTLTGTGSAQVCSSCQPTHFYKVSNNSCTEHNCELFDEDNKCLLCSGNYISIFQNQYLCNENPFDDDDCSKYSPKLGHCVDCKVEGKIPYAFFKDSNIQGVDCVAFALTGDNYRNFNIDYPFLSSNLSGNSVETSLSFLKTPSQTSRLSVFANDSKPSDDHCFPFRTVPNCKTMGNGVYCSECNDTYLLDAANQCVNGHIDDCKTFDHPGMCTVCMNGYFLATNQESCTLYSTNLNCATFNTGANECLTCETGVRFKESPANNCVLYASNLNCNLFNPDLNACSTCADDFLTSNDSGVLCTAPQAPNCATYHATIDKCLTCIDNYWLNISVDPNTCDSVTATNCETKSKVDNECLTCKIGHWLDISDNNKCKTNTTIEKCTEYKQNMDDCNTCDEGYYASTEQECRLYPDGIANCTVYTDRVTCTKCQSTHVLISNKCEPVTEIVDHCEVYSSVTACEVCSTGKFLKDNVCVNIIALNCLTVVNENKCETCPPNYILDSSAGTCTASGINHCIDPVSGTPNTCSECVIGKFLSTNKQLCETPDPVIENCADYETASLCKTCSPGYIRSLNKKNCTEILLAAGQNCSIGSIVENPICDDCKLGYKKGDDGTCEALTSSNCGIENLSDNVCILCQFKSSMDKNSKCTLNAPPVTPCTGGNCSAVISRSLIALLFVALIMNLF